MDALSIGTRRLLAAVREANAPMTFAAAALAAYGLLRRLDGSPRRLVYSTTVRRGERIEIAVVEPDSQRTR